MQYMIVKIVANDRSLMHFEWQRSPVSSTSRALSETDRHQGKEVSDYGEDGLATYTDGTKEEKRELSVDSSGAMQSERAPEEVSRA